MRGLLLVDLDNVLDDDFSLDDFVKGVAPGLESLAVGLHSCAVGLVFNTTTLLDRELCWPALAAAGRRLANALGSRSADLEVGVTLTMPQTADVLLSQLLRRTPSSATDEVQLVGVFSGDRGLLRFVRGVAQGAGWVDRQRREWRGELWQMPRGGLPLRRRPCDGVGPVADGRAPSSLDDYTVEIRDDHRVAAWAAGRSLDLDPGVAWGAPLFNLLEREPWLLSQIGATTRSLRGVARMHALMSDAATSLGSVARNDGLEVRGNGARPTRGASAQRASVGIGAVRFVDGGITARSRLPVEMLAAMGAPCVIAPSGVFLSETLKHLPCDVPLAAPRVKVRFETRRRDLVAEVTHADDAHPAAWWLKDSAAENVVRASNGPSCPRAVLASATPMRPRSPRAHRVILAAPRPEGPVTVDACIGHGTIGPGHWCRADKKKVPVALLALGGRLAEGATVSATPIQVLSRVGMLAAIPESFWGFPIVVAQ